MKFSMRRVRNEGQEATAVLSVLLLIIGLTACGGPETSGSSEREVLLGLEAPPDYAVPTLSVVDAMLMPTNERGEVPNNAFALNLLLRAHHLDTVDTNFTVAADLQSLDESGEWLSHDREAQRVRVEAPAGGADPAVEGEVIITGLRGAGPEQSQRLVVTVDGLDTGVAVVGLPLIMEIQSTYQF